MTTAEETELVLPSPDGWALGGILRRPEPSREPAPVTLLVPDSHHERDVYTTLATALAATGIASLRLDVRGRGASRGAVPYSRMGPAQRRRVEIDVAETLDQLGAMEGIDQGRMAVVTERDTAPDVISGAADRVKAIVVMGARPSPRLTGALRDRAVPVLGLVSAEDRTGLRGTTDAYLAGRPDGSQLIVLHRRGFGATMFSSGAAAEEPLEAVIASWLQERLQ